MYIGHKVHHHHCVYYKIDWSVYTCLTQPYGGRYMYNLLHKEQLQFSGLFRTMFMLNLAECIYCNITEDGISFALIF